MSLFLAKAVSVAMIIIRRAGERLYFMDAVTM